MINYSKMFLFLTSITLFVSCGDNAEWWFGEGNVNIEDSLEINTIKVDIKNDSPISLPKRLLDASVTVKVYDNDKKQLQLGSGVFVKSNLIATNFHVIKGGTFFCIERNSENMIIDAEIYKLDKLHDVALLKIGKDFPKSILDLQSKFPEVGIDIMVAGSPEGLTGTLSKGIVSAIRKYPPYDYDLIQISASISHGSSGGPVVNMAGEIIGISVSNIDGDRAQNLNFAVPAKYVQFLLLGL